MAEEGSQSQDMWTPFKELQSVVDAVLAKPAPGALTQLKQVLRKHKQNFITLLKNPPKNAESRETLRKGISECIHLPGMGYQILSKELVDEAIIISDMFDLNEILAIDLLCTAQQQLPFHPGLNRGLVAILLYYDGRKALVSALRSLVHVRKGFSWAGNYPPEIVDYITLYTNKLMEDGVLLKILDLLECLDLSKELELLHHNRALGGPKHQHQVVEQFQEIRQALADIIFLWTAQTGLPKDPTFKLINHLKSCKIQDEVSGGIDGVNLALEMALLCALDLSLLHRMEDGAELVRNLPLLSDTSFIPALVRELSQCVKPWECSGLQATTQLAWALALTTLRLSPNNLYTDRSVLEEDEIVVETAIDLKVFDFLHTVFLENKTIYKEQFYLQRLHTLITDFLVLMPTKVKELRTRGDETARTVQVYAHEGLEPPASLTHHFEHLLLTVERFYRDNPLGLELALDFWCPTDTTKHSTIYLYGIPSKQVVLFKFVRMAGEMLPPTLFVPYLKMLRSLASSPQCSRYAFNMLKENSSNNLSWDHFFSSLERYYNNLRQELPPSTDTVYRHRVYPRGITPQEIQGLQAVLGVTRTVAEYDDCAQVALCENPHWNALNILLGLVSCSVPIPLKAELLLTLAALARSPSTAATLWHSLEASQILTTVPSISSYQPRGVQTELEEIESRNEEFPLTRALLHLMDVLTNLPVPRLLGAGSRTPGFDPYLQFIMNSVFLRFNTRTYKNPGEKWEVANGCLMLLVKFVTQYEPHLEDFVGKQVELQGGGLTQVNPPSGFHLMIALNSKSELIRLVLYIIHEGCQLLDSYSSFPAKEMLESCTLLCLQLIQKALNLQQRFLSLLSGAGSNLLLTGLSKLLLDINPRSGQPDNLLNITKYVTYNSWLPEHTLCAVGILQVVTTSPNIHNHLVGLFTSTPSISVLIRHGFVECLDSEQDDPMDEEDEDGFGIHCHIKEAILKFLQQSVSHSAPNVAHYLLGFDTKKDIKKMVFQQPGVQEFPRTCLHSIINMLDNSIGARSGDLRHSFKPRVIEKAYCMLYSLCADTRTYEPVLRFLRSCNDFLVRHLACLPFSGTNRVSELNQMSWLLKTVAIELRLTSMKCLHSHLKRLVELLTQEQVSHEHVIIDESAQLLGLSEYRNQPFRSHHSRSEQKEALLLTLLSFANISELPVPIPQWEFFSQSQIEQVLSKCERSVSTGLKLVDVKQLHHILMDELFAVQSTATAVQRQLFLQETEKILTYALKHNNHRSYSTSTVEYMDAWRQVMEVLCAVTPPDIFPVDPRMVLLLEIIHVLLKKVVTVDNIAAELAVKCSGMVMIMMVNLRHSLVLKTKQERIHKDVPEHQLEIDSRKKCDLKSENNMSTLRIILSNIIKWILSSSVSSQKLRANLYGALLNYLHIMFRGGLVDKTQAGPNDNTSVNSLDSSRHHISLAKINSDQGIPTMEILVSAGECLLQFLCLDCIGGHNICKLLALSCVNMLIDLDPHVSWITFLSMRGYIRNLIDSLMDSDVKLISVLETAPETLGPLYIYESKMALLCRIAATRTGAELLLEQGALACLSSMQVFDRHPDINTLSTGASMDFYPSISSRYMQILFPALNFCDAILTSLGTKNQSCTAQVLHFLMSHNDTVNLVLHSGSPYIQLVFLKELARLTCIISRASQQDVWLVCEPESAGATQLHRMQQLMLALFPFFVVSQTLFQELSGAQEGGDAHNSEVVKSVLWFFRIACNLVLFARNIVASQGVDHRATRVIFKPTLGESRTVERRFRGEFHNSGSSEPPNLGVVVKQLVQCVDHHIREKASLEFLCRKLAFLPSMNATEMKEFLPEATTKTYTLVETCALAEQQLESRIINKKQELQHCMYLIENCLYLLWSHLDYYMLRAIPRTKFGLSYAKSVSEGYATPLTESAWKVTMEDISALKQGLVTMFNDSFSKKLLDIAQNDTSVKRGFIEALLRRIKRLIQFVPVK